MLQNHQTGRFLPILLPCVRSPISNMALCNEISPLSLDFSMLEAHMSLNILIMYGWISRELRSFGTFKLEYYGIVRINFTRTQKFWYVRAGILWYCKDKFHDNSEILVHSYVWAEIFDIVRINFTTTQKFWYIHTYELK